MDVYMVVLESTEDTFVKFVDEEVWNWITNPDTGWRDGDGMHSWDDKACPLSIRTRIWETMKETSPDVFPDSPEEHEVFVSSGSLDDDRAMNAPTMLFDGKILDFNEVNKAVEFANENGLTIKDTYEGCFY